MSAKAQYAAMKEIEQYSTEQVLELLDKAGLSECFLAIRKRGIDGAKLLNLQPKEIRSWKRELNAALLERFKQFIDQLYENPQLYVETAPHDESDDISDTDSEPAVYQNFEDQRVVFSDDDDDSDGETSEQIALENHQEVAKPPPPPPRIPNNTTSGGTLVEKLRRELMNQGFGIALPAEQPPALVYGNEEEAGNSRSYQEYNALGGEYTPMSANVSVATRRSERPIDLPIPKTPQKDSLQLPKILTHMQSPGLQNRPLPSLPGVQSANVEGGRKVLDRGTSRTSSRVLEKTTSVEGRARRKKSTNSPAIAKQNAFGYDVPKTPRNRPIPELPSSSQNDAPVIHTNRAVSRKPSKNPAFISNLEQTLRPTATEPEGSSSHDSDSNNDEYIKPIEPNAMSQPRDLPPIPTNGGPPQKVAPSNIEEEPYFRNITRAEASRLLADTSDGTFLIRPSQQPHGYTLMVRFAGKDFNIKVRRRQDGKYATGEPLNGEVAFASVQSMIKYYSHGIEKLDLFNSEKTYGQTYLYPISAKL